MAAEVGSHETPESISGDWMLDYHQEDSGSGEELLLLIDAVQDYAIFMLDVNGVVRSWNRGAARIFGYPANEVIGRNFTLFYEQEDLEVRKPSNELATAERDGRVEDEGWRVRKDGVRFWADTIITAIRDDTGHLCGFGKVTRDMTESRAARQKLKESEELVRLLVSSVSDYAIFMLDPEGYVTSWNAGAEKIKGYTPEEIIGKHFSVFYPIEERSSGKPDLALRTARELGRVEYEGWRVRKNGTRFWADVIITAVRDETGRLRGFAKVTRDVTDRKNSEDVRRTLMAQREARLRAEAEQQRAEASYEAAREANRAKDSFLMTLSHELRTPITSIIGWTRLLPSIPPMDPAFESALRAIGESAEQQAQIIDDVLDVSRIFSGKMQLNIGDADIEKIVRGSVEVVRPSADANAIAIEVDIDPELKPIRGDSARIQQIVWNLLTNAVKFTQRNGRISVAARRKEAQVEITVTDTGEGIDPDFIPHIFEPFRQAEHPRTRVHGGLGLGLSIVRYLTEAHGGTITAESRGRGLGSTFMLSLPVAETVESIVPSGGSGGSSQLHDLRVLLIDGDREDRFTVRAALEGAGAAVVVAESAPMAMSEMVHRRPDVVLTDIATPMLNGYAFAREVRRNGDLAGVKLIALSEFAPGRQAAEESGFDAYLLKPIGNERLIEVIANLATGPRSRDSVS